MTRDTPYGEGGIRTLIRLLAKQLLYRWSYIPLEATKGFKPNTPPDGATESETLSHLVDSCKKTFDLRFPSFSHPRKNGKEQRLYQFSPPHCKRSGLSPLRLPSGREVNRTSNQTVKPLDDVVICHFNANARVLSVYQVEAALAFEDASHPRCLFVCHVDSIASKAASSLYRRGSVSAASSGDDHPSLGRGVADSRGGRLLATAAPTSPATTRRRFRDRIA